MIKFTSLLILDVLYVYVRFLKNYFFLVRAVISYNRLYHTNFYSLFMIQRPVLFKTYTTIKRHQNVSAYSNDINDFSEVQQKIVPIRYRKVYFII